MLKNNSFYFAIALVVFFFYGFLLSYFITTEIDKKKIKEAHMIGYGRGYTHAVYRTFQRADVEIMVEWPLAMVVCANVDSTNYRKLLDSLEKK